MTYYFIDISFSCTPRIFTSQTMVHHNRALLLLIKTILINNASIFLIIFSSRMAHSTEQTQFIWMLPSGNH